MNYFQPNVEGLGTRTWIRVGRTRERVEYFHSVIFLHLSGDTMHHVTVSIPDSTPRNRENRRLISCGDCPDLFSGFRKGRRLVRAVRSSLS